MRELVRNEIRNKVSQSDRDFLMEPTNLVLWQEYLAELLNDTQDSIDQAENKFLIESERYRGFGKKMNEAYRFMHAEEQKKRFTVRYKVNKRLDEVTRMVVAQRPESEADLYPLLKAAIMAHKRAVTGNGDPRDVDYDLWDSLDGKWSFGVEM